MSTGRFNDKTKIRYDDYLQRLRAGADYTGFTYERCNAEGVVSTDVVPYLICDNGYHRWLQLMCPCKTTSDPALAIFSKKLESVRKDAERCVYVRARVEDSYSHTCTMYVHRTFGSVKKRFRILKTPLLFRDAIFINNIFVTCCTLHNILLQFDNHSYDGRLRYGVDAHVPMTQRRRILVNNTLKLLRSNHDLSYFGEG